jgi:hypothetical protein
MGGFGQDKSTLSQYVARIIFLAIADNIGYFEILQVLTTYPKMPKIPLASSEKSFCHTV